MKQSYLKMLPGIILFTLTILSAGLSQFYPEIKILFWITILSSLGYLFLGWLIFKGYYPKGEPVLLVLSGYFYSGVLMGSVFTAANWPLANNMTFISFLWIAGQFIIVIAKRNKMAHEAFIQFLIEAAILLILSVILVVRSLTP
jgi:hypothetical protein